MRRPCLFILFLLLAYCLPSLATDYGNLIYAKSTKTGIRVFEKQLGTTPNSVRTTPRPLPVTPPPRTSILAVSPTGRYLVVGSAPGLDLKSYGSRVIQGAICIWDRDTKVMRTLASSAEDLLPRWSADGSMVLLSDDNFHGPCLVYNVHSGVLKRLSLHRGIMGVSWFGEGVVAEIVGTGKRSSSVYLTSTVTGKSKLLISTPNRVDAVAKAPRGGYWSFASDGGVYLVGPKSRKPRRLSVTVPSQAFGADMVFSPSANRLAVLISHSYGEPCVNTDVALWSIDVRKESAVQVGAWSETLLSTLSAGGTYVLRSPIAWLGDDRTFFLDEEVNWAGGPNDENRDDWHQLTAVDMSRPAAPTRTIFDSRPGCTALTWHLPSQRKTSGH